MHEVQARKNLMNKVERVLHEILGIEEELNDDEFVGDMIKAIINEPDGLKDLLGQYVEAVRKDRAAK